MPGAWGGKESSFHCGEVDPLSLSLSDESITLVNWNGTLCPLSTEACLFLKVSPHY